MKRMSLVLIATLGCGTSDGTDATDDGDSTSGQATTTAATGSGQTTTEPTDGGTDGTGNPPTGMGCDGQRLLDVPDDPAAPGPWPVGASTVDLDGLTVEIWYPAVPGSEQGVDPIDYDIREALPPAERSKIDDGINPLQRCNCARDLPIDAEHGPYPSIIFVHGTAAFRNQSLEHVTHWASRGFIVAAADHPGLKLADILTAVPACGGTMIPRDLPGDIARVVTAVKAPVGPTAFLAGIADPDRVAMAGHSAGGSAIAGLGDAAQVLIPMAAGGTQPGDALQATLVLGALEDTVVTYDNQQQGYEQSPAPKRLVGYANAGHLAFSSLCAIENDAGDNILEIAEAVGVCGANLAGLLFDCSPDFAAPAEIWPLTNHVTTAVLEQTLHCRDRDAAWVDLASQYPLVSETRSE